MLRSEKKQFVSDIEQICRGYSAIFVTHYRGMTVLELSKLKKALKLKHVSFKVVKNTLVKIAAKNADREGLVSMLSGPVAIAYSDDAVAAAKLLDDFVKQNGKLKIIGGVIAGSVLGLSEISEIAKLPSLNEIRAKLIATVQTPATNIARVLGVPAQNIARVLSAYAENSK